MKRTRPEVACGATITHRSMSLGLFTVDDENHLWFDVDCWQDIPAPIIPKHCVFNIQAGGTGRILLLHTGYTLQVFNSACTLLGRTGLVTPTDVAGVVVSGIGGMNPAQECYARIVYECGGGWAFLSIDRPPNGVVGYASNGLVRGTPAAIGLGDQAALASWRLTSQMSVPTRLRGALQAAAVHVAAIGQPYVTVPAIRQPARLDRCTKPYAYPTELLT